MEEDERQRRGASFNDAAQLYDEARPGYPDALFDDIIELAQLKADSRLLEIGSGTGRATLPFARRGYNILGVEPGANMVSIARRNVAGMRNVDFWVGSFEEWPLEEKAFDLVYSAQAFHWLDPATAMPKIAAALAFSGSVALIWNVHVPTEGVEPGSSEDFYAAVQEVYAREAPELTTSYSANPRTGDTRERAGDEIERSGLFGPVTFRTYDWDATYDAISYTRLLSTYSDHLLLPPEKRAALMSGIADLIDTSFGGSIVKSHVALLYIAAR